MRAELKAIAPDVELGIRHMTAWHPDPVLTYVDRPDLMSDPDWLDGLSWMRRLCLSFDLQVYPWQMAEAAALARSMPDVAFIVNQAGMPLFDQPEHASSWRKGLSSLAAEKNVSIKLSGFGMCGHPITEAALRPLIREVLRLFGHDRVMFASNFPLDGLFSSLEQLYAVYRSCVADLPEADRRRLFASNAARTYRLSSVTLPHEPAMN